ncbi:hypothetical protein LOTGIDRAFT_159266 [Lottia gigantea]|uniref:Uncharacterized protein n=1 Tax=Lottia gigantea TaxID=225164 RepID=V4A0A6_LOTGI|nr:hypothetical protein LOTGIDRAFT_159266 [Lottia gigantea]ESO97243.1 hypothetical protein LOTGIDRAFT_159266 [Lottia gigantea]
MGRYRRESLKIRYYKLMLPDDHRSVFSEINTKLLVMGLYLLVAFILFNPIYGWGEYSEYKGFFQMNVHMTRLMSNNSTGEVECGDSNFTQYIYPGDINSTKDLPNIITSNLKSSYHFYTRMVLSSPELLVISLRTSERETLDSLLRSTTDGALGTVLLPDFSNCDMESYMCLSFVINETVIEGYKNIFVPFQDSPLLILRPQSAKY